MRISSVFAVSFFLVASVCPSTSYALDLWESCVNIQQTDAAIALCTKVIEDTAQEPTDRAKAYSIRAHEYTLRNDFDHALADYSQAIQLLNGTVDPAASTGQASPPFGLSDDYNDRGTVYMAQHDHRDRGTADFDKAIQIDRKTARAYFNRANIYVLKADLDRAIADYSEAIRFDHDADYALVGRARAYSAQGDFDSAISDYDRALELNPIYVAAYIGRGAANLVDGRFDRALLDYNEAIQIAANDARLYVARGLVRQASGKLDDAISDFTQAVRIDSQLAIAYYSRGLAYRAKGDNDHAANEFAQAFKLDPKLREKGQGEATADLKVHPPAILFPDEVIWIDSFDVSALVTQSESLLKKQSYDLAIAALDKAVVFCQHRSCRKDDDVRIYFSRGEARVKSRDYDRAISDYGQAIKLDPQDAKSYSQRGLAYNMVGETDLAISDYSRAIQIAPQDANLYYRRGFSYQTKGDFDRAIVDSNQTIKLAPQSYLAFNMRCWIRATFGRDLPAAQQDCNKSLQLKPGAFEPLTSRGLVQFRLGAFAKAVTDYTAALAQEPKDPASLYVRGVAKLHLGDKLGGDADIAAAKKIAPNIADIYAKYGVS
jgi:tetratricopeptide (TPR) repeat protein